jgi:hypothetical protein
VDVAGDESEEEALDEQLAIPLAADTVKRRIELLEK